MKPNLASISSRRGVPRKYQATPHLLNCNPFRMRGFTLLEVLVALVFFALIGVVLQEVTASTMNNTLKVRANAYATWIAENKLAELRIDEGLPATKEYKEDIEFGVDEWLLTTKVIGTENPDIHRVEVTVALKQQDEPKTIRTLTGFIGRY